MKNAIVTGANGFIGRALLKKLLAEGYSVWAVVRTPQKLADMKHACLTVVAADGAEYGGLDRLVQNKGFDVLFHLAWDGVSPESHQDFQRQMNNVSYAAELLKAAKRMGVRRYILVSSIVSLEAKHYMLVDGGEPRIATIYGTAKAAAENVCKTLAYQNGLEFNTAVLANAYGEGDRSNMVQNTLIRMMQRGEEPKLADGGSLYDWIYVDDVAAGLLAVCERGIPGKAYYVGHRKLQRFEDLVSQTRDIMAPGMTLTFGTFKSKTAFDWTLIDREALYRDTGFECHEDFGESIRKTAAWLRILDS